jgi:F420H2 dehydrogenase subunit F
MEHHIRPDRGEQYLKKVNDIEYSDKPISLDIVKKLATMKHKNNKWDWREFMKEIWSSDSPPRPWGRERLEKITPEIEKVEKIEKTEKPAKPKE